MHEARHYRRTRVVNQRNLKAAQKLPGRSSISPTSHIYADCDIDRSAHTMRAVLEGEQILPPFQKSPANRGVVEAVGIEPA